MKNCKESCDYNQFADPITGKCTNCNLDCQTCSNDLIASCLSCNPVKYLLDGICVTECPAGSYENVLSNYTCKRIYTPPNLSVKIQTLGYKNRIPKDIKQYLKAEINNTAGSILTITWT